MSRPMADGMRNWVAPELEPAQLKPSPARAQHVPALDGVRGVAILGVMIFHLSMVKPVGRLALGWERVALYGELGVDAFFVLSGFLITGILLDARGQPHYFKNFYARRVLRIFPLYYAVTAFSFFALPRLVPWTVAKYDAVNHGAIWYWIHLSNFAIARRGIFVHGIMDVSWSLAIEEQFYLLWPAVVLVTLPRRLRWVCLALVALSCASRLLLTTVGINPVAVYTMTFCRLDGLALGALVALAIRRLNPEVLRVWSVRAVFGSLGLAVLMLLPLKPVPAAALQAAASHLLVSVLAAGAILFVKASPQSTWVRVFGFGPLRAFGRYSYGLYLFHYPIAALARDFLHAAQMPLVLGSSLPSQLVFYAVAGAAAFMAAAVSWHAYEKRFLALKRFFERA